MNENEYEQPHESEDEPLHAESELINEVRIDAGSEVGEPAQIKRIELEPGPSLGMRRNGNDGLGMIDGLAGRSSVLGFGCGPIVEAIQAAAEGYLGDASALDRDRSGDHTFAESMIDFLGESSRVQPDSVLLCPSADEAVDCAIGLARQHGGSDAFRTIAFVGSDHGRTGMCRSASGRPELSTNFGPMMAGFAHVANGDLDAVRSVISDQTACVLLAPIDFADAARPIEPDFLSGLRELCDQHGVLLVIDETRIAFGASGQPFTFASIADVQADMVIVSAGLFAGLPGGLIIGAEQATGGSIINGCDLPVQSAVAMATLAEISEQRLFETCEDSMHEFAIAVAEVLGEYQFIRDVHVSGMTLGIEADIMSEELVQAARQQGLRIESAGDTAFRLQPPLVLRDEDQRHLLEMMTQAMDSVKRATANFEV